MILYIPFSNIKQSPLISNTPILESHKQGSDAEPENLMRYPGYESILFTQNIFPDIGLGIYYKGIIPIKHKFNFSSGLRQV